MTTLSARLPDFESQLRTLVGCPSVSSKNPALDQGNLAVINHLATWLADLGFQVDVETLPDQPHKGNMIAKLGGGDGGLLLAGHTDTVPWDEHQWQSDPFQLAERGNAFYGLGTCDMKGFFPLVIDTVRTLSKRDLQKPLTIVATADEESSMAGARALVDAGRPRAQFAIIGEPTGLNPVYAHKGIMMLSVCLKGHTGHSSDPSLGRNALDAMHRLMGELIELRDQLAAEHQNPAFEVAIPTMNLGCLHAGDNPNRICGEAELQIDVRLLPGMSSEQMIETVRTLAAQTADRTGTDCTVTPFYPPVPPFEGDAQGDLAASLSRWSGNAGQTVAFGTEAPFFQSLGMETVVFGPGSIDQAHQPNEYLSLDQVIAGKQVLTNCIRRYCLGEGV